MCEYDVRKSFFSETRGAHAAKTVVLGRPRRELTISASLGVCVFPLLEESLEFTSRRGVLLRVTSYGRRAPFFSAARRLSSSTPKLILIKLNMQPDKQSRCLDIQNNDFAKYEWHSDDFG